MSAPAALKMERPIHKHKREKKMSEPTTEYLLAKAELCTKTAMQQLMDQEISEAIKNMERANRALGRIFNIEEGEGEDE